MQPAHERLVAAVELRVGLGVETREKGLPVGARRPQRRLVALGVRRRRLEGDEESARPCGRGEHEQLLLAARAKHARLDERAAKDALVQGVVVERGDVDGVGAALDCALELVAADDAVDT